MGIKSLSRTSPDELFEAFEQAFVDYEVQLNKAEHLTMFKRRGFNPRASSDTFDGDKLVSFTCNRIGNFYGVRAAYDTGTGILKDYQGRGLATQIFEYSIPYLRGLGIEEYLSEVLQHNTGALSVYRKLSFEITREFYYLKQKDEQVNRAVKALGCYCTLKSIKISGYNSIRKFRDFEPPWQNSFEATNNALKDFICLGVFLKSKLVGYGALEPVSGDITQITVDKEHRRGEIGSLLFQEILESNKYGSIKIINTGVDCNPITIFLKSKNTGPVGKQFEMVRKL